MPASVSRCDGHDQPAVDERQRRRGQPERRGCPERLAAAGKQRQRQERDRGHREPQLNSGFVPKRNLEARSRSTRARPERRTRVREPAATTGPWVERTSGPRAPPPTWVGLGIVASQESNRLHDGRNSRPGCARPGQMKSSNARVRTSNGFYGSPRWALASAPDSRARASTNRSCAPSGSGMRRATLGGCSHTWPSGDTRRRS